LENSQEGYLWNIGEEEEEEIYEAGEEEDGKQASLE
jgi:hypothetical protein